MGGRDKQERPLLSLTCSCEYSEAQPWAADCKRDGLRESRAGLVDCLEHTTSTEPSSYDCPVGRRPYMYMHMYMYKHVM